jgi:hypothetical protein
MHVVGEDGTLVMSAYPVSPAVPLTGAEVARGITWKVRRLEPGRSKKQPWASGRRVQSPTRCGLR